ncbi:uncharacterized protein MELLADRAFT_57606 [Melampsora larici-populina 98AG31]|uniref:Uncharacterized protein n=1 Tax=Melampsora larici-populina (strain 98AG31 / pathotype 3-4-7) TaxID=747676 RepID=F4S4N7_MELLP|nr:uncharacterized protein MELLADRAFT_57606 [Melampsora larici-populina 98AG31]EGG00318.1 hypothetical protein MELLADRAFT_57606 [Melampsora larici-populina 98AG31]
MAIAHTIPSPTKMPDTVVRTLKICDYMKELDFSPKEFMVTFFSGQYEALNVKRRLMKTGLGIKSTWSILNNLRKLTSSTEEGQADWEVRSVTVCD